MYKGILVPVCVTVAAVVAYSVGARYASAQVVPKWCWVTQGNEYVHPECAPCGDWTCSPCDQGTCPGNYKICNKKQDWVQQQTVSGWTTDTIIAKVCFTLFGCKPRDSGPCSPTNPCVADWTTRQDSASTFPYDSMSGWCTAPT